MKGIATWPARFGAQVIHGDLAAPNVLLSRDRIGAVVDYQPPVPAAIAYDTSRIGCDPRTVLRLGERWPAAMAALAHAYRQSNVGLPVTEIAGCVRWLICYPAASTYPLRPLLADEAPTDGDLATYARQRHEALRVVLDRLDGVEEKLRSTR